MIARFSGAVWKKYACEADGRAVFERALARGAVYNIPLERVRVALVDRHLYGTGDGSHPFSAGAVPAQNAHCIVVFRGLDVGVFADWLDCAELVLGVSCALYNGYDSMEAGSAAFARARDQGFVVVFESRLIDPPS
ncbi:hypothetical protein CERSUDRAFT_98049 [Gelatoporia subvermispora B]|uniref:Ribonuclease H1 N-terminal domain-containing protein n=1 Tax=Ceriporiopsis subvermispora (strain B) TaxID=914234 RepID=M2PE40_CERS8|nr:hypothetical protein CERSUDRAFT_101033 [Gelatoporia subvermispora B]EMD34124.1 hypothetical protein CERSUDRAFT_98049 [Gelatoporia subvermispora B]